MYPIFAQPTQVSLDNLSSSEPEPKEGSPIEPAVIQLPSEKPLETERNLTELLHAYRSQKDCQMGKCFDWVESQLTEIVGLYDADPIQCTQFLFEVFLDRLQAFGADILLDEVAHKQNEVGISIRNWKKHIELFLMKSLKGGPASTDPKVVILAKHYSRLLLVSGTNSIAQKWLGDFFRFSSIKVEPEMRIFNLLHKDPKDFNEGEITSFCFLVLTYYKMLPGFGRAACQDHLEKLMFLYPAISSQLQIEAYSAIRTYDNKPFQASDVNLIKFLSSNETKEIRLAVIHLISGLFKDRDNNFLLKNKRHLPFIREVIYSIDSFISHAGMGDCEKDVWELDLTMCLSTVTPENTPVEELFKAFTFVKNNQKRVIQRDLIKSFISRSFILSHSLGLAHKLTSKDKSIKEYFSVEKSKASALFMPMKLGVNSNEEVFCFWEECLFENIISPNVEKIHSAFIVAETFFLANTDTDRALRWAEMIYMLMKLKPRLKPAFDVLARKINGLPTLIQVKILPFFVSVAPELFDLEPQQVSLYINAYGLIDKYAEPLASLVLQCSMDIFKNDIDRHHPMISTALMHLALKHKSEAKVWTQETWNKLFTISLGSEISLFDNSGMALLIREMPRQILEENIDNILSFVASSLKGWNRLCTQGNTIELLSSLRSLNYSEKLSAEKKGLPALLLLHQKKYPQNKMCIDKILHKICTEETYLRLSTITQSATLQNRMEKLAIAKVDLSRDIEENNKLLVEERNKTLDSSDLIEILVFRLQVKARIAYIESLNQSAELCLDRLSLLETNKRALKTGVSFKDSYKKIIDENISYKLSALNKYQDELSIINSKKNCFKNLQCSLFKTANEVRNQLESKLSNEIRLVQTAEKEIHHEMNELFNSIINSDEPLVLYKASVIDTAEKRIGDRINRLGPHVLIHDERKVKLPLSTKSRAYTKSLKAEMADMKLKMNAMLERIAGLETENETLKSKLEKNSQKNGAVAGWGEKTMPELFSLLENESRFLANSKSITLSKKYTNLLNHLKDRTSNSTRYYKKLARIGGMRKERQSGSHIFYCFKLENTHTLKGTEFTFAQHSLNGPLHDRGVKKILSCLLHIVEHDKNLQKTTDLYFDPPSHTFF